MSTTTYPTDLVLKQDSIRVLEILSEPVWKGEPEKDAIISYWETTVLWCDIDIPEFLIGLEDPGESLSVNTSTITIEDVSPTYIKKGTYKREILAPNKIIFKKVA